MAGSSTVSFQVQSNAHTLNGYSGALIKPLPPDLLLVIFIHGYAISSVLTAVLRAEGGDLETGREFVVTRFKGTDSTFSSFPKRLEHVLSKSIDNVVTECIVFPEYEVSHWVCPHLLLSLTVSRFRPKAIWYLTSNSIQRGRSKLKRSPSMLCSQTAAVQVFSEWLTKLVVEREVANGNGGGAGKAKIVFCGHRCVFCVLASDSVTIGMP